MTKQFLKVTFMFLSLALFLVPIRVEAIQEQTTQNQCISQAAVQLKGDLRRLWTDHAIWTRSYIVSALAGLKDQEKVLERLLRNQQDIGNAIKPYYGEEAGNKLASLLKDRILIAGKIVDAAKKGDQAKLKKYNAEWYKNADDIAQFLSSANPNWPMNTLKEMLHMHLQLLSDALNARLKKDWDAEIIAFDKGLDHLMLLADTITEGIIKQFPTKF